MKVYIVVFVVIGCVSARGSGPYLPSGWKPSGPPFYLPSEVPKPSETPIEDPQFPETEASGSNALREYGPPKVEEVFLNINQGLPDVATEHAFFVEVGSEKTVTAVEEVANVEGNTQRVATTVLEISPIMASQKADTVEMVDQPQATERNEKPSKATEILDVDEHSEDNSDAVQTKEDKGQEEIIVPTTVVAEEIVVPTGAEEETVVPLAQQELVQEALTTATAEDQASVPVKEEESVQDNASTVASKEVVSFDAIAVTQTTDDLVKEPLPIVVVDEESIILKEMKLVEDNPLTEVSKETTLPATLASEESVTDVIPIVVAEEETVLVKEKVLEQDITSTEVSKEIAGAVIEETEKSVKDVLPSVVAGEAGIILEQKDLAQDITLPEISKETTVSVIWKTEEIEEDAPSTPVTEVVVDKEVKIKVSEEKEVEDVNDNAEGIVNLENEVKRLEVTSIEETISKQETSGAFKEGSEGFLDNGPPGFAVYGPPQQQDIAKLATDETKSGNPLENNEPRRRRFSPKFRFTKSN